MPLHTIEAELASGALIEITSDHAPPGGHVIDMVAIYRTDSPPGPAGRWFIDRLKQAQAVSFTNCHPIPTFNCVSDMIK
jgi:DNA-binding transcriptional LysR family regulator